MSDINTETVAVTEQQLPEAPAKMESTWTSFVPMILIFGVFYFLLIRPQEKKRKQQEQLINSVKKGEEILTTGGIYGKVTKVNESESTVMVEISENNIVKLSKSAIIDIVGRKVAAPVTSAPNEKTKLSSENNETKTSSKAKFSKK